MGNFAENLNLGNRFRPPCVFETILIVSYGRGKRVDLVHIFHLFGYLLD